MTTAAKRVVIPYLAVAVELDQTVLARDVGDARVHLQRAGRRRGGEAHLPDA